MAAGAVLDGSRSGVGLPGNDVGRVKSHLRGTYEKMGDTPWDR